MMAASDLSSLWNSCFNSLAIGCAVLLITRPGQAAEPTPAVPQPVKVFILSGQSNMVGAGKVTGGGRRWGAEFLDPVVSVYQGEYDPQADYDARQPVKRQRLESFGGVRPTPYPGGGAQVVRGFIAPQDTGVYEFRPGYGGSTHNIMEVAGEEV